MQPPSPPQRWPEAPRFSPCPEGKGKRERGKGEPCPQDWQALAVEPMTPGGARVKRRPLAGAKMRPPGSEDARAGDHAPPAWRPPGRRGLRRREAGGRGAPGRARQTCTRKNECRAPTSKGARRGAKREHGGRKGRRRQRRPTPMTREEMPAGRNRRLNAAALSGQGHGPGGCPRRATGAQAPGTPQRARVPIKKMTGFPAFLRAII